MNVYISALIVDVCMFRRFSFVRSIC